MTGTERSATERTRPVAHAAASGVPVAHAASQPSSGASRPGSLAGFAAPLAPIELLGSPDALRFVAGPPLGNVAPEQASPLISTSTPTSYGDAPIMLIAGLLAGLLAIAVMLAGELGVDLRRSARRVLLRRH